MRRACSFVLAALLVACGTRVSLGELPDGERLAEDDETLPAPVTSSSPSDPAPTSDAGDAVDAGRTPADDAGNQDGGPAPYVPCAGKACGDSCRYCAPGDPNCFEPAVIKQCDKLGACVAAPTTC